MKVISLASGSGGNATLVSDGQTTLLVDAGFNARELERRAAERGEDLSGVSAVLVTHEHSDHIAGLASVAKYLGVPIYAHSSVKSLTNIENFQELKTYETGFCCRSIWVKPFRVSHDAAYTVGYRFTDGKSVVALATDLGEVTDNVRRNLFDAETVLLESNYDDKMLLAGRYAFQIKHRIQSRNGHLSNYAAAEIGVELVKAGNVKRIILAHLSRENNTPETAFAVMTTRLFENGIVEGRDVEVLVARK